VEQVAQEDAVLDGEGLIQVQARAQERNVLFGSHLAGDDPCGIPRQEPDHQEND